MLDFVVQIAEHPNGTGKIYRVLTPRVFLPRMLGAGKRNPRPWDT